MAILLLFDIDGTVLDSAKSGRNSLKESITAITGTDCSSALSFSFMGKTDRYIIQKILHNLNIPFSEETLKAIKQEYSKRLLVNISNNPNKTTIAGIDAFLRYLTGVDGINMGLQTGNFREGAFIKLRSVNLDNYFKVGGFGDSFTDRTDVIKQAITESEIYFNNFFPDENIIVIGDTPADIISGKRLNTRTIAVCSNPDMHESLQRSSPGLIIRSFCDKNLLYSFIKNGTKFTK